MYGKFGRPSTYKKIMDYGKNVKINSFDLENSDFNAFKNLNEDPSNGPQFIEKKYPMLYKVIFI